MPLKRGLIILACLLLTAASACSSTHGADPGAPTTDTGIDPARLSAFLESELDRLGVDQGRTGSQAPGGTGNEVFDLAMTEVFSGTASLPTAVELAWTEQLTGDYNQDGLVNVSDLTPVGQFWNFSVGYDDASAHGGVEHWPSGDPEAAGAENWRRARVDGNADGLIYMSDITTIAQHWEEQLSGYVVERAYLTDGTPGTWEALSLGSIYATEPSVPRSRAYPGGSPGPYRYRVEVPLADALADQAFRIAPYDIASGERGPVSAMVSYLAEPGDDTDPPVWTDATGVTSVTNLEEGLEVQFGTAVDLQSPPVSYRVYWEEYDPATPDVPFDYTAAACEDTSAAPLVIAGVAGAAYYRVAVRARDSAPVPNWEENTETAICFNSTGDIYPPEWQGTAGIQGLMCGDGTAVITWGQAVDSHDDGTAIWSSGPVIYRIYHGPGTVPAISTAEFVEFADEGRELNTVTIDGLDTSTDHWFVVRARDQAEHPNEDANTISLTGTGMATLDLPVPDPGPAVPAGFNELRTVRIVSSPDRSISKLACVWGDASGTDSWLSSWLITPTGLDHDMDRELPHDHILFLPLAWQLDGAGNHELLYTFTTIYETGDQINYYRQADDSITEHVFEQQYVLLAGFDLNLDPWVIGYIDNGFAVPYPYFELYFAYLPVIDPVIFLASTPDAPQSSYYFHSAAVLNSGAIEFAGRDNANQGLDLRLQWTTDGIDILDDYVLPAGNDTLQMILGRGQASPLLSYSGPEGDGYLVGFSRDGISREYHAPQGFTADDEQFRIQAADGLERAVFATCLTGSPWYAGTEPVELNTIQLWYGEDTVAVPLVNGLVTAAEVETVAVLSDGRFGWVWRAAGGEPWQLRIGDLGAD